MIDDRRRRPALSVPQRIPEKWVMPIVPGGFDEDAAQMRIAGFGDRAADLLGAAGVLGRNEAHEGHGAGRGGKAARVAEFTGFFLLGRMIEFGKTEKIFTKPSEKKTEDYITGRFG